MYKLIRVATVPQSLKSLLKGQLDMLSKKFIVLAVSSPGKDMDIVKEREGVRIATIPMERRISVIKDFVSLYKMIRLFRKEKPDIVHSITPKAGLLSMLAAYLLRVPVRIHTFTGLVFPSSTGYMQKILILMDRIICFCATHIYPEGEGVKQDLIRYKITSKPLNVVANGNINGIDLNYFDRTSFIMESAIEIRKDSFFTFCFVGRIVRDKGINELISAFVKLYEENDKINLILIGSLERDLDPILSETEKLIHHHPAINFEGYQSDIRPFLAASDVFVFPSYREGFPNVVMQAGAMGVPAIVTDINGCNEIIVQDKNGVIIPPKDEEALLFAMKDLVSSPEKVSRLAANAREMITSRYEQRLVWEGILKEYQKAICTNISSNVP